MPSLPFVELKHVSKGYGAGSQRREVLKDLNLNIDRGEFVAIVGYSGSGKTTLISLLAGLIHPDAGTVIIDGSEVVGPGPDRGIVFQNYSLLPWLNVFDNIALAVDQIFPNWPKEKRREHIEKYIAMVNLTPARSKRPHELSGGMRQRVSVARALAMNPEMLLLDEPLSALDALTRATLQDEIEQIWERDRKTVVLITNDVDEGLLLADRVIPLSAGPGATLGPAVEVDLDRPRDRKTIQRDPHFKRLKAQVLDYLLGEGARKRPHREPMQAVG
ncbi:MAG: ABC transporter ATP-binding protein [Planctomycetia bacterium]|nr:ABC transporter ATP-binding protein [Planctomycetia bacterium]